MGFVKKGMSLGDFLKEFFEVKQTEIS